MIYAPAAQGAERWARATGLDERMESLPVKTLAFDANDRLFVGTEDGIYVLNSAYEFERDFSTVDGLFSNEIHSIAVTSDGLVYAHSGRFECLCRRSDSWTPILIADVLGGANVYDLFEAEDNHLWFRTDAGVGRLD